MKYLLSSIAFLLILFSGCSKDEENEVVPPPARQLMAIFSTKDQSTVHAGLHVQLQALGSYDDDSMLDITDQVAWISDDTSLATVDENGRVTTFLDGNVVISAALGSISSSTSIEILPATLSGITITSDTNSIPIGLEVEMTTIAIYTDGDTNDVTMDTEWSVSNESIAQIVNHSNDIITLQGLAIGTVIVSAKVMDITTTKSYSITETTIQEISISSLTEKVQQSYTLQLLATARLSDDTPLDVTSSVEWSSSDINKATVSDTGLVSGHNLGSVVISATKQGKSQIINLEVIEAYRETHVSTTSELRTALSEAAQNGLNDRIILAGGIYKTTDDTRGTFRYSSANGANLILDGSHFTNVDLSGAGQDQIINFNASDPSVIVVKSINLIDGETSEKGGGLYVNNNLLVVNCNIENNNANSSGGGIQAMKSIAVIHSIFSYNTSAHGGGFYTEGSVSVVNSKFIENYAQYNGGGLSAYSGATVTVSNSLFIENRSDNGGAINAFNTSTGSNTSLKITNSLFKGNTYGVYLYSGSKSVFVNNIFYNTSINGQTGVSVSLKNNYVDPTKINVQYTDSNNIFDGVNFGFVDEGNEDYHLSSTSDLIDVGLITDPTIEIPTIDFDGNSRPQGVSTDIGPYEYRQP